ncbi:MAG: SlyX family protein [Gammaproteobacteria bacterium]|nr:SlyX family protein [Gammaproteobacteria bacterium]MDH5799662.1 SlyX family protein [Gammaproteobacteria bacterium]
MESRIIDLEIRIAHQEASIDELTKAVLELEKQNALMTQELLRLHELVKHMSPSPLALQSEETPPPHY